MYMKKNGLSSTRRSKTEIGACAHDHSGFVPAAGLIHPGRSSGVAPPLAVGFAPAHASQQTRESRARGNEPREMLKMKEPPGMCLKIKDR